ncbi:MAG: peptidoglycan DD-metalloendopeptidase family protein [Anaerobiospirillum succiniciproducens]|uniref:peptidoglycan DD-metalloendopeptidase family protein n=1 Tax=Anaerobiospirillum succiniciproducens TaxID=13335 RepID=UPI002A74E28D|nr:peptidoglycan DD-metalloendopeptidase family protein [Anaerobiospirillum succiniciproducens]MDY2798481.1 peptidoglycan DD-metalloendopeptidase family protein [Anaerobiospirillum succiniciproducens]
MKYTVMNMMVMSLLVSLVTGCETSNQNYSHSGRVVDITKTSSGQTTVNRRTGPVTTMGNNGIYEGGVTNSAPAPVVTDSAVVETPVYETTTVYNPAPAPVPAPAPIPAPQVNNGGATLIGGVPDDPVYSSSTTVSSQTVAKEPQPKPSEVSGNWLLVDSEAANKDVAATPATQSAISGGLNSPDRYTVVKGDTLYSIAFRYGLDYHSLAKINNITPPYNLALGQVLVLNLKAQEAPSYIVQRGDTLYSIARKNNQSVSFLAGVNNLEPPYNLKLGQKILLSRADAGGGVAPNKAGTSVPVAGQPQSTTAQAGTSITTTTTTTTTTQKGNSKPATTVTTTQTQTQKVPVNAQTPIVNSKTRKVAGVTWSWPTTGKVIEQFSTSETGNKGIDIAGNRGQAILSAADGQVVYSGNALRGFGNLIIINHNNEYLSAYAHNDVMLVKEGQKVKRGQHIARMGNTDAASTRLHFEIRYRGQSVNPVSYLPK